MDNMSSQSENPLALPRVQGPKLEPFQGTTSADIQFLEFLGSAEDLDSKVWKARMNGHIYALKVVSRFLISIISLSSNT